MTEQDEQALCEFIAEGTKAWADVPDAAEWVRVLRGHEPAKIEEAERSQ